MILKSNIIVAQATAKGPAPLGIIRYSGEHIRKVLEEAIILKSKKKLTEVLTHSIHYGEFVDMNGKTIDQVVVLVMDAPRSFTGEDTIEINCHNNQFIINNIIKRSLELGISMAKPGEFSQRAVNNKKIDIFQAEAINELLHAENELLTEVALSQVQGSLSAQMAWIDDSLSIISAWCQASFEFLDEERDFRLIILEKLLMVIDKINYLLKMYSVKKFLKDGVRVALIGSVNVGKSSLFNFLLGYKRAIVNSVPGTTRDTIESVLYHKSYNITLIDTAGIRLTDDSIEQEGILKTFTEAELADIILLVYTEDILSNDTIKKNYTDILNKYFYKTIILKNKIDICHQNSFFENELLISTQEQIGLDSILKKIDEKVTTQYNYGNISYIINIRHVENLNILMKELLVIKDILLKNNPFYEIILYHLLNAQKIVSNLSGKSIEERSLDKVFQEFCVGK